MFPPTTPPSVRTHLCECLYHLCWASLLYGVLPHLMHDHGQGRCMYFRAVWANYLTHRSLTVGLNLAFELASLWFYAWILNKSSGMQVVKEKRLKLWGTMRSLNRVKTKMSRIVSKVRMHITQCTTHLTMACMNTAQGTDPGNKH